MPDEESIDDVIITRLEVRPDQRGWLVELFRHDELAREHHPVMAYASQTGPGVMRGPHEHRQQTDCFLFVGPGSLRLYLWDARKDSSTYGNRQILEVGETNRVRVLVPPGVVHAYANVGDVPALVINCPNRLYAGPNRREVVDEIRHENQEDSPYEMDSAFS